jgi:hypothetical protein
LFRRKKKEEFEAPIYEADEFIYSDYYDDISHEDMWEDGYETDSSSNLSHLVKKRKAKPRKRRSRSDDIYVSPPDAGIYDELAYEQKSDRKGNRIKAILILAGIYLAFVILGAFNTTYVKMPDGTKKAQVVDIDLREKREVYYFLESEYNVLVQMLKDIQDLEAKAFGGSDESMFEIASKYEGLLPRIDKRLPRIKAVEMPQEYKIIQTQFVNIYKDDIALYLQNISKALSMGDQQALQNAVTWSQKTAASFRQITRNMGELAHLVELDTGKYSETDGFSYQGLTFSK